MPAVEDAAGSISRNPLVAAGVPADEAVAADQHGDALERGPVALAGAVERELGHALALVDHGKLEAPLVPGLARLRSEDEPPSLDEQDARPREAALHDDLAHDLAQHLVRLAAAVENPFDGLERSGAAHAAPASKSSTARR